MLTLIYSPGQENERRKIISNDVHHVPARRSVGED